MAIKSKDMKHKCPKCGTPYPVDEEHFHRDKTQKSGFNPNCKRCALIMQAKCRARPGHLARESLCDDIRFGSFERACLREEGKRGAGNRYSIYEMAKIPLDGG